jgi:hypothetical protein
LNWVWYCMITATSGIMYGQRTRLEKTNASKGVNGHGPMSDIYDDGGEGDTPSFLYLISSMLGLNDHLDPTQGSWGSMFKPMGGSFPERYYYTCDVPRNELLRWIPDATSSFMNRLRWSVKEPGEVNRNRWQL